MKIELGETNGFLFGGVPSLVVVAVTFDDGRVVRFPYEAGSTIADLYSALGGMNGQMSAKPTFKIPAISFDVPHVNHPVPLPVTVPAALPSNGKIEKGDIVRCIFLENRNDHAGAPATVDLSVGGIYRVHKVTTQGYQVIDDNAPMKFIMFLARHEVELYEKGRPIEKKVLFIEREFNCPKCNLVTYCELHEGFFIGKCECGQDMKISQKEANSGQGRDPNAETVKPGGASGNVQEVV